MGWQIPICQKGRSPLQSFKKSMPDGICRIGVRQPIGCLTAFAESEFGNPFYYGRSPIMGWQIPICQKGRRPLQSFKKSMPDGICRIGVRQPIGCLTAFAESEFGNPFYKGRSPIMGWQIPICQKGTVL